VASVDGGRRFWRRRFEPFPVRRTSQLSGRKVKVKVNDVERALAAGGGFAYRADLLAWSGRPVPTASPNQTLNLLVINLSTA